MYMYMYKYMYMYMYMYMSMCMYMYMYMSMYMSMCMHTSMSPCTPLLRCPYAERPHGLPHQQPRIPLDHQRSRPVRSRSILQLDA